MSERYTWLSEGNGLLGEELLEGYRHERAPSGVRRRSMTVARAALTPVAAATVATATAKTAGATSQGVGVASLGGSSGLPGAPAAGVSGAVSGAPSAVPVSGVAVGSSTPAGAGGAAALGKSLVAMHALDTGAGLVPGAVASSGTAMTGAWGSAALSSVLSTLGSKVTIGAMLLAGSAYVGVASLADEGSQTLPTAPLGPAPLGPAPLGTARLEAVQQEVAPPGPRSRAPLGGHAGNEALPNDDGAPAYAEPRRPSGAEAWPPARARLHSEAGDAESPAALTRSKAGQAGAGATGGEVDAAGARGTAAAAAGEAKRSKPGAAARLAEELRLIKQAREQLRHGSQTAALRTLGEHARRFPAGALTPEAAELRRRASGD